LLTLDRYNIDDFLILDEGPFFLLGAELDDETAKDWKKNLDDLVNKSSDFDNVTIKSWSPARAEFQLYQLAKLSIE